MSSITFKNFSWQRLVGNGRLFVLCLLLFAVSAFFSFWITFPAEILQRRLLQEVSQQAGIELRGDNATMLFPLGMELDLTISPDVAELNNLELSELQITPGWGSLISGTLAVNLKGNIAGGEIDAEATKDGWLDMSMSDIAVATLQHPDLPYQVSGLLSGQMSEVNIAANNEAGGEFSFQLKGAKILGLEKLGLPSTMPIGDLHLEGKVGRQRLNLEKISVTGGIMDVGGGGNILIGKTVNQTRLNLNLRFHPTTTTPKSLIDLIGITGMRPTVDGSYLLRLGGTLLKPIIR